MRCVCVCVWIRETESHTRKGFPGLARKLVCFEEGLGRREPTNFATTLFCTLGVELDEERVEDDSVTFEEEGVS
jgi:hypothetical protein